MEAEECLGQLFTVSQSATKAGPEKAWAIHAVPKAFPPAHMVVPSAVRYDKYGRQWVDCCLITSKIPVGLHCEWLVPLIPNDNSQMRPGEKHNVRFGFSDPAASSLFKKLSYLRCDNSFLVPRDLLTPLKSENFSRVDLSPADFTEWLDILNVQNIIEQSTTDPLWAVDKSIATPSPQWKKTQTIFFEP